MLKVRLLLEIVLTNVIFLLLFDILLKIVQVA